MHVQLLKSWKIQFNIVIQFLELLPFNGRNTADKALNSNQSIKQFLGEKLPLPSFWVVHLSLLFLSITPLPCDFISLLIPAGGVHVGRGYRPISGSFTDLVFNVIVTADWTGYQRFHWNKYPSDVNGKWEYYQYTFCIKQLLIFNLKQIKFTSYSPLLFNESMQDFHSKRNF